MWSFGFQKTGGKTGPLALGEASVNVSDGVESPDMERVQEILGQMRTPTDSSEDDRRFRAALLYVAEKGSMDPDFGLTKIYKALILGDILCMSTLGHTITKWKYLHFKQGPIPRNGHKIVDSLKAAEIVKELTVPIGP